MRDDKLAHLKIADHCDDTIVTFAAALSYSTVQVRRKIKDGTIKAYRPWPGAEWRIPFSERERLRNGGSK